MEKQGMNRRDFLRMAVGAAAVLPLAAILNGCGSGGSGAPATVLVSGGFVVASTLVGGHTHNITVRTADLAAGVQVTYTSTSAGSPTHTHTATITPAQINDINAGKTDPIGTNTDATLHTHNFLVKKP